VPETNLPMHSKIIMITDGEPTEIELVAGPDVADSRKLEVVCTTICTAQQCNHFTLRFS